MKKNSITHLEAVTLVIAGLFIGTVFTFGMRYWNAPVAREEAVAVTAVLSSSLESRDDGDVKEILLRFEDHQQLHIDGACITDELRSRVSAITPGTTLSLLVHPNSSTVMELRVGEETLMEFEYAAEKLTREADMFMWLGIFLYAMAAWGLASLILRKLKKL